MINARWQDMLIGGSIVLTLILVPLLICFIQNCQRRRKMRKRRVFAEQHRAALGGAAPGSGQGSLFFIDPHRRASPASAHSSEGGSGGGAGQQGGDRGYLNYAYMPPTYEELVSQGVLVGRDPQAKVTAHALGAGDLAPQGEGRGEGKPQTDFVRGEETRVSLPSYDMYLAGIKVHKKSGAAKLSAKDDPSPSTSRATSPGASSSASTAASPEPHQSPAFDDSDAEGGTVNHAFASDGEEEAPTALSCSPPAEIPALVITTETGESRRLGSGERASGSSSSFAVVQVVTASPEVSTGQETAEEHQVVVTIDEGDDQRLGQNDDQRVDQQTVVTIDEGDDQGDDQRLGQNDDQRVDQQTVVTIDEGDDQGDDQRDDQKGASDGSSTEQVQSFI